MMTTIGTVVLFEQSKEKHQGSYLLKNIIEEHVTCYKQI